jgi:hypothetical protein
MPTVLYGMSASHVPPRGKGPGPAANGRRGIELAAREQSELPAMEDNGRQLCRPNSRMSNVVTKAADARQRDDNVPRSLSDPSAPENSYHHQLTLARMIFGR